MRKISSITLCLLLTRIAVAQYQYVSPMPGAKNVTVEHNIILRPGSKLKPVTVSHSLFTIHGSKSGTHEFKLVLCDDGKTINLNPTVPFAFDEVVTVSVMEGMMTLERSMGSYSFSFSTHREWTDDEKHKMKILDSISQMEGAEDADLSNAVLGHAEDNSDDNLRKIIGMFTITTNTNPSPGDLFFDTRSASPPPSSYNSINAITINGDSVFQMTFTTNPYDFKVQKNGYLTTYKGSIDKFFIMDSNFIVIDTIAPVNGYAGDPHELVILENNYAFLIGDENETILLADSVTTAVVLGMVVQELDPSGNAIFEWRSFDHVAINEAQGVNLNAAQIDYIHTNSIEVDTDGNIIVSHRHLDQVDKIDVNTGDFIWRLGGVYNEFTFVNDSEQFSYQHDARRLPNGNITLYDDGNYHPVHRSWAKEYRLNEDSMTATLVWSYAHPSVNGVTAYYSGMGRVQRMANGNTLIGWGYRSNTVLPNISEVDSAGNIVWELKLTATNNLINYRVNKYEWSPCARPTYKLLGSSNITDHSATISWHPVSNPTQLYEVQYKRHTDLIWTDGVVSSSQSALTLSNLDAATEYDWRIQSWCDTTAPVTSHFTAVAHFTTLLSTLINEVDGSEFEIYPNPANDELMIECGCNITHVRLLNLLGQEVKSISLNRNSKQGVIRIPVADLPSGNYFVEVTYGQQTEIRMVGIE